MDSSSIGRFVYAAFFYLVALVLLGRLIHPSSRRQMSVFQQGSKLTYVMGAVTFFIWGTVWVGLGLDWPLARKYGLVLEIVSMALLAACFGIDWLRCRLPR
jgi:hypothetical protein